MAATPGGEAIRAILLDIEGTTTPIDFVFKTLFPYARMHLGRFLREHASDTGVLADIEALRAQHRADIAASLHPPAWIDTSTSPALEPAVSYGQWLMDRDSKCAPLKSLQGKIWQEGYAKGELHGQVYPDVPPAFARWSAQGKIIAIFSSGSVLAQQLLFSSTASGDLTRFLTAYFDTTIGPKNARASYVKIAAALQLDPRSALFISDVAKELDGARDAGMATKLCVREQPVESGGVASMHVPITSFDGLFAG